MYRIISEASLENRNARLFAVISFVVECCSRFPTTGGQSFQKLHKEVLQDSEWYGPEAADHAVSPAAAAAAPAAAATREDVRLITSFTKYLTKHKVELSVLFCSEAVLSADSRAVCDPQAAHQLEGAVAAAQQELVRERVASVSEHQLLGLVASPLVDALLAAMPEWTHGSVWELAGWEPAEGVQATAEDVALLHCFGTLVYASRLDVAVFLRQLCGADPFSWTMAQVAQGVVPEPEPWLLERFFMSKHTVGEPLPLWFAKWGVREEIIQWLQGEQAARFVQNLLETRGLGGAASMTAVTSVPSAATVNDLSAALDLLEGSVGSLMASALLRQGLAATPEATPATGNAAGTDQEGLMAALVAVAVQLPYGGGAAGDVTVTAGLCNRRYVAQLFQRTYILTCMSHKEWN
ncbi:hypothetical protein VOLCADRAFT_89332 [Volvox carteri f. nagariensis]|uniref:Uncharacterized protein n=1 Tax=Volvox carteri f. nagariensis TaxID=3068 RepID=D8TRF5_VOLCA|nr:uncharacterized protein VOLCADRAFT_89332 [Volvox carteri f. nagariensis]EFJ49985.1 hypothetical protein VOLCADRAFT_89332 [Volvox carteri f. nagariensis]|eukprot:XP_002949050.1 hypothetical protein VOLCADRAFT_89332 [Volvox carteri f. nagariensis]